jgi:phosphoglycerate dehydrogenase-like enzyme
MTESRPDIAVVLCEEHAGTGYDDLPPGLSSRVGDQARLHMASSPSDLREAFGQADAAFVWDFRTNMFAQAFPSAARLRWVHVASVGVDAVLTPELVHSDVTLTNSRGVFDRGIAEWVLGVLLIFTKGMLTTLANQRQGDWRHHDSALLEGKHLLVVGAGSIGRSIARLCKAAGMTVDGIARRPRSDAPDFGVVAAVDDLDRHLPRADAVVSCLPLTSDTKALFDASRFAAFDPRAVFVNVGRGPVVQEDDLVAALEQGRVGAAALDVFETEPLPTSSPLWTMPNVIVSPHCSGDVEGWRERLVDMFVENLGRFRRGEELINVVEKPS